MYKQPYKVLKEWEKVWSNQNIVLLKDKIGKIELYIKLMFIKLSKTYD
jgi:hypothetical protein